MVRKIPAMFGGVRGYSTRGLGGNEKLFDIIKQHTKRSRAVESLELESAGVGLRGSSQVASTRWTRLSITAAIQGEQKKINVTRTIRAFLSPSLFEVTRVTSKTGD